MCPVLLMSLVVQRFLGRYPGLQDVLKQARKVCVLFRRSYNASARLADLQKKYNLPKNRPICAHQVELYVGHAAAAAHAAEGYQ